MSDLSINSASFGPANPVRSIGSLSHPSSGIRRFAAAEAPSASFSPDRVELSESARLLNKMRDMPDVRADRIEAARAAIARGEYDAPDRLSAALDRMLSEIAEEDGLLDG